MRSLPTHVDTHEMRKALDDLLQTFLVVAPRNADHPAVKRAKDLVSRRPQAVKASIQHWNWPDTVSETRPDIPESFVIGTD